MKDRPQSPLITAAYRRIERIEGHEPPPNLQGLLQKDLSEQQATVRFETSVCGPKCIEHLIQVGVLKANRKVGYKAIAKLCGATDLGTTVAQMKKGLDVLGIRSFGYELNPQDLSHAPMPAIALVNDHYTALLKIEDGMCTVFDPMIGVEEIHPLTKETTSGITVLLFSPIELP